MQGAHHFAGGIEIGCEVIHTEQCQRSQQANLPCTVNMGILLFFTGCEPDCNDDKND